MTRVASAAAAGAKQPEKHGYKIEKRPHVMEALTQRMAAVAAEVDFSRKEAHDMYMDAYRNADTATEQIAAVNAMVKLHGLEKPKELLVTHEHTHTGDIELLPTDELIKLAGLTNFVLEGEFEEVETPKELAPPEITDDNTNDPSKQALSALSEDY
jgi:hypothetical protein